MNISKFLSENISTPVDVIKRYTMLLNNEEFSEKVKEMISMLQKQASLFPDIIQAASNYNKPEFKLKLESFSLKTYLNSISELLSEYCDSRNINLFKKFSTIESPLKKDLDMDLGSTGLGLFLSKEIVELHEGEIWAESEGKGKGSTFIVKLPIGF